MTSDRVSDERLAEMLAGLEGVTPGPWDTRANLVRAIDGDDAIPIFESRMPWKKHRHTRTVVNQEWHNLNYVARCGPDIMRSILSELQQRRSVTVSDEIVEPCPNPMATAPKDGSMLRLRVRFDGDSSVGAFEDADEGWTIGSNNFDNTGDDDWEIVGWDWEQDVFRRAHTATPIGWLPFHAALIPAEQETRPNPDRAD